MWWYFYNLPPLIEVNLDFELSQSSAATYVSCGGIFIDVYSKFPSLFSGERMFKIG